MRRFTRGDLVVNNAHPNLVWRVVSADRGIIELIFHSGKELKQLGFSKHRGYTFLEDNFYLASPLKPLALADE
jgi:hypothetical protein